MRILVVAVPGVQLLDIAGPLDVFAAANRLVTDAYEVHLIATEEGPVTTRSGLQVNASSTTAAFGGQADTLVVTGSPWIAHLDPRVLAWLQIQIGNARRIAAIGEGVDLMTKADVVQLRRNVRTCQGGAASVVIALEMVEEDHGRAFAQRVAQALQGRDRGPMEAEHWAIRHVQAHIRANIASELSIADLARHAGMSERHFTRIFRAQSGVTPTEFVKHVRIEEARRLLEASELSVNAVAQRVGYSAPDAFRRVFTRQVGMEPSRYRRRPAPACTSPPP